MALLITPLWLASAAGWASWVAVHWLTGGLRREWNRCETG